MAQLLGIFVLFCGIVGVVAAGAAWGGYVLTILWGWFVTPQFNLPALSIPVAIGLDLVAGLLTHQYVPRSSDKKKQYEPLFFLFAAPAVALLVGWAVKQFM